MHLTDTNTRDREVELARTMYVHKITTAQIPYIHRIHSSIHIVYTSYIYGSGQPYNIQKLVIVKRIPNDAKHDKGLRRALPRLMDTGKVLSPL